MTAHFMVRHNATKAEIEASPLGRVIKAATDARMSIVYGDGYPAHHGGWWQPISWNPAGVRVVGQRPGVTS